MVTTSEKQSNQFVGVALNDKNSPRSGKEGLFLLVDYPYRSPETPPPLGLPPEVPRIPWNGWWTLLWIVLLVVAWQIFQGVGMVIYLVASGGLSEIVSRKGVMSEEQLMALVMDGDVLGGLTFGSILVVCPLAWMFGKLKKPWGGMEYLGQMRIAWWQMPIWLGITFALMMGMNALGPSLGMDEMHDSMVMMTQTTDYPILLFLGIAVGAPLVEEFIFRGIAWRGWRNSAMGLWGTVAATTVIWGALHLQYLNEPPIFIFLAVFGVVLGLAREYSGNIWVPVAMHALNNGVAAWAMLTTDLS